MQFSIFGVPFKCTKDMFTWEKVKWSIFVYWAQLWRGGLFSVVALLLWVGTFFLPGMINSNELEVLYQGAESSIKFLIPIVYASQYWYQQMFVTGIMLLCLWFIGLILGAIYIQYYSMFKKNYLSFSRQFNKPEVLSLWSWGFWKPFILITLFSLLFGFVEGFVLGLADAQNVVIGLIGLIIGLVLFHIFLHGGTWGFVPIAKQQPKITK